MTERKIFNKHGYGNVTVVMLAHQLNMTKGNLWYHFTNKRALLEALSEEFFEADDQRRKRTPVDSIILKSYIDFFKFIGV